MEIKGKEKHSAVQAYKSLIVSPGLGEKINKFGPFICCRPINKLSQVTSVACALSLGYYTNMGKEKDQEENVQKDLAKLSEGGLRVRERIWANVLEKKKKKRKIVL